MIEYNVVRDDFQILKTKILMTFLTISFINQFINDMVLIWFSEVGDKNLLVTGISKSD